MTACARKPNQNPKLWDQRRVLPNQQAHQRGVFLPQFLQLLHLYLCMLQNQHFQINIGDSPFNRNLLFHYRYWYCYRKQFIGLFYNVPSLTSPSFNCPILILSVCKKQWESIFPPTNTPATDTSADHRTQQLIIVSDSRNSCLYCHAPNPLFTHTWLKILKFNQVVKHPWQLL